MIKDAVSYVLVTGASGGIGSAIAREFALRGADLLLAGRDGRRLEALANELRERGCRACCIECDLTRPDAGAELIETALTVVPRIDTLVNCAGVQSFGFFSEAEPEAADHMFRINTLAPIELVHALLPQMLRRRAGSIVNVGSIFGSIGFPCYATYSATKFALRGFSEALRRELAGTGVSVTYVAPRFTKTTMNNAAATRMADAANMRQDEPAFVARQVLEAIERGRADSYLGWPEKLFVRINALLPRLVDRALERQAVKMRPFAEDTVQGLPAREQSR